MCAPNNPFVMTKPNGPSEGPGEKSSSPKRTKFDFMFMDCCSFLGLGLGIRDDFQQPHCASTAMIYSDDGGDSITLDDTVMGADSWTLFDDVLTLDTPSENEAKDNCLTNHKSLENEEDTKPTHSTCITMIPKMGKVTRTEEEDDELSSRLDLLPEILVWEDTTTLEDEEESKTLNTRSTLRIPSSLDTQTWDKTLEGLQLVETIVGDTTEADTGRNYSNPSYSRPRSLYHIKRVPSMVDTCGNDDQSAVSSMSIEEDLFLNKAEEHPNTKRLLNGKGNILRPWLWNKAAVHKANGSESASEFREPSNTLSSTQGLPKPPSEASRSTVPMIKPTKSIDVTATTIGTDEDGCYYYREDNVPFDEPYECSPGLLPIEEVRIG
jgi:hypothetical protein